MNKALKVLVAIVGLFLLAACGEASVSTTSTEDGSGTSDLATASLQDRFEANQWELVDRAGFDTEQGEVLFTFEVMELDDTITMRLVDCGWESTHAILWSDGGFALTESQNSDGGYGTDDQGCFDDMQQLLIKGRSAGQFVAEISDDGTSATVTRGGRVLHLVPTGPAAEPEPAAPAETTPTTEQAVESERPRRPVTFLEFRNPGDQLEISLTADICNPEAPEIDVVEDAESITITITEITPDLQPDDEGESAMVLECQSTLRAPIDEPVNGRRVIDGTTGEEALVRGS